MVSTFSIYVQRFGQIFFLSSLAFALFLFFFLFLFVGVFHCRCWCWYTRLIHNRFSSKIRNCVRHVSVLKSFYPAAMIIIPTNLFVVCVNIIAGKPVSWIMIAPSITPIKTTVGSNNPAMRLYKFDTDTGQVSAMRRCRIEQFTYLYSLAPFLLLLDFILAHVCCLPRRLTRPVCVNSSMQCNSDIPMCGWDGWGGRVRTSQLYNSIAILSLICYWHICLTILQTTWNFSFPCLHLSLFPH